MTRETLLKESINSLKNSCVTLIEAATGMGKTCISIKVINHLVANKYKDKQTSLLLLVAKRVHKITWLEEIRKWGGLHVDSITIECYESLKKHLNEEFTFILMDEVHHINSDLRLEALSTVKYDYIIGLSATIPFKLKQYFRYTYHSQIVSCDIIDAIEDEVLPEPTILLLPLQLDNTKATETWEINPRAKGPVRHGLYKDLWNLKKQGVHAVINLTPKQKLMEFNRMIDWEKNMVIKTRSEARKFTWLHHCGERLEWLASMKIDIVRQILRKLSTQRTITFCKTIEQAELLGKNCIHSKNGNSDRIYNDFNAKRINHITAVNILNENANLVDCKYAVFVNYSSSEVCSAQRLGRSMRHKSPVIILPFYKDTREEEIIKDKMLKDFSPEFIKTISTTKEII